MQKPSDLQAAVAYLNRGQSKKALQAAKAAMRKMPRSPFPHNLAGLAATSMGKHLEAAKHFQAAAKADPNFVEARRNLAQALIAEDRIEQATAVLKSILAKNPTDAGSHYMLAQCAMSENRIEDAEQSAREAIEHDSGLAVSHNLLGAVQEIRGDLNGAIISFENALKTDPRNVEYLINASKPLARQLRLDDALKAMNAATKIAPDHIDAHLRLGQLLMWSGRTSEAIDRFWRVLDIDAKNSVALERLSELLGPEDKQALGPLIKNALENTPNRATSDRCCLHFAQAQLARNASDIAGEIKALAQANKTTSINAPYDREAETSLETLMRKSFPEPILETKAARDGPVPIFVIGLPRSGTTLTEAILGAHSDVLPLGEVISTERLLAELLAKDQIVDESDIAEFRERDTAYLPEMPPGTRAYVDKMPENARLLGVLKASYPNCKVINLIRDPRDVALSMWRGHFAGRLLGYTSDLSAMAQHFNSHARMVEYWHSIFPGQIFDLRYEELVQNVAEQSAEIAAYCELDWQEIMTRPHESVSLIMTLSTNQVRKPVSTSSVGAWRRYADVLAPMIEGLDMSLWEDKLFEEKALTG